MKLNIYASGSTGNLYVLGNEKEALLIEAGLPIKKIKEHLDFDFSNIRGCLVSHEHGDHAKGIKGIGELGIDVYSSKGTLDKLELEGHRFNKVKDKEQFTIGSFNILAFDTQHDAAEPLGFLIQDALTGKKLLFATDTYYIKYKFKGLNQIALECNYSEEILQENVNTGKINGYLAERIRRSHFSLENVLEFLKANDLSKLEKLYLIHLSESNADGELFRARISEVHRGEIIIAG